MNRSLLLLSCGLLAATIGCAPRLLKLPSGPGQPASDARAALAEATAACRDQKTMTAEVGVSGSVGGQRLRGRLLVGLETPASARLEAVAPFGPPIFIFVARGDDATLLLPRDERVLEHGKPSEVLEAVAGVPLDAAGLRVVLTGCATVADAVAARAFGDHWRSLADAATEIYLRRDNASARWTVAALIHLTSGQPAWRAEYREVQNGLPRSVRLVSGDRKRFDLRMTLSQVDVNVAIDPDAFRIRIPSSAQPISIDELRHARPGFREN